MHPGIDFGYFEFPEFADAVSGEIFLFKVHIYGLPADTEIFCDFFDGEPSVFYQIKLFHCNIPEISLSSITFNDGGCHHIPFGIIYQCYREISNRNARKSVSFMQFLLALMNFSKMCYENGISLVVPYCSNAQ